MSPKMPDICILGARGYVGRNLAESFGSRAVALTRHDLNLMDQKAVDVFFANKTFKAVFHCAVRGGSRLVQDGADIAYENLMMFETVTKHAAKFEKFVYFSSGARFDRLTADMLSIPMDYYGFSKFMVEKRAESVQNLLILRIYGCFGVGELSSRFLTTCLRDQRASIVQDRYFDYFWIEDVCRVAGHYVAAPLESLPKVVNLVYREKLKLSALAEMAGASYEIQNTEEGLPYIGTYDMTFMNFEHGVRSGIKALAEHLSK
jgi:nucleoside-diphosphate-sugar epimerase